MRALVLGGDGMMGHKLLEVLSGHVDLYVTYRKKAGIIHPKNLVFENMDVNEWGKLETVISIVKPDVIINCVGIVKQKKSDDLDLMLVNNIFPKKLASYCIENNVRLFHLSTDCVFSGVQGNYKETDTPCPVDIYGASKYFGEVHGPGIITIRTSMIGWQVKDFGSLLSWFVLQRGKNISGYQNVIFSGLSTAVLSKLILDLILVYSIPPGLYHIPGPAISKFDLLNKIKDQMGLVVEIEPEYSYHIDRSLCGDKFYNATGWRSPSWNEMIAEVVSEWPRYKKFYNEILG